MTTRRTFVSALPALLAGLPRPATAQTASAARRIALLVPDEGILEPPFHAALRTLGYVEGRTLAVERRSARGRFADLPALAAELVQTKPEVVVAFLTQAAIAAKAATATIPVVMVGVGNPVASGIVPRLSRPGGNVTGTAALTSAVVGKQLELIRELRPQAKRVATLWNPGNPVYQAQTLDEARAGATRLGLVLELVEVRSADEFEPAFRRIAASRPDALLVLGEPLFVANAPRLQRLLPPLRLPAVGGSRAYADTGVIAIYTPDLSEAARRAAHVVDRILRGSRPGDIPVEVVSKYELVVDVRIARSMGVAIPAAVLARADEVLR